MTQKDKLKMERYIKRELKAMDLQLNVGNDERYNDTYYALELGYKVGFRHGYQKAREDFKD